MSGPIRRTPTGRPIVSATTGKLVVDTLGINPGSLGTPPPSLLVITVNTPSQVTVGSFVLLAGTYLGTTPTGVEYSVNGGASWSPVQNFHAAGGIWSGVGPPAIGAGTMTVLVRNTAAPAIAASTSGFLVR